MGPAKAAAAGAAGPGGQAEPIALQHARGGEAAGCAASRSASAAHLSGSWGGCP